MPLIQHAYPASVPKAINPSTSTTGEPPGRVPIPRKSTCILPHDDKKTVLHACIQRRRHAGCSAVRARRRSEHQAKRISLRVHGRRAAGGAGSQGSLSTACRASRRSELRPRRRGRGRRQSTGRLRLAGCQSLCAAQQQAEGVSQARRPAGRVR
jgi:hypothetical protein